MFKETTTEKLIEYIQSLPAKEQRVIVRKIIVKKKDTKVTSAEKSQKKAQQFFEYTKQFSGRLPKGYKFDREEANER